MTTRQTRWSSRGSVAPPGKYGHIPLICPALNKSRRSVCRRVVVRELIVATWRLALIRRPAQTEVFSVRISLRPFNCKQPYSHGRCSPPTAARGLGGSGVNGRGVRGAYMQSGLEPLIDPPGSPTSGSQPTSMIDSQSGPRRWEAWPDKAGASQRVSGGHGERSLFPGSPTQLEMFFGEAFTARRKKRGSHSSREEIKASPAGEMGPCWGAVLGGRQR